MIRISHQTGLLAIPFEPRLGVLFPHGKVVADPDSANGAQLIIVPHGIDETKLLRNLDMAVPAPIEEHYDFPSIDGKRAFAKQVATAVSMTMHRRSFVLNSMGTGKTKSAIWAFDWLKRAGLVRRMLVVAPLSTLEFTWGREFFNTIPKLKVNILQGRADKRRKLLADMSADVYVINHDGVQVLYKDLMLRHDIDVVCFDEAAAYRNARADRSKAARNLASGRKWVWAMTGSPTPTAPTDAYGLARLVVPDTAPKSFTHFRQDVMVQVSQFKWVPKRAAAQVVANTLQPSVRFTLDEIVELPPCVERELQVPMGDRQAATYKMLKEHAAVLLKEGTITAANGGIVYNKLLQISLGWVYGDDGKTYELDNNERVTALLDIIEGDIDSLVPEAKVIVFSPFISAMHGIERALEKEKIPSVTVSGATTPHQRRDIFQAFQHTDKYKVLNAHPECMSHGLTLTAADTIIWFGPTMKLEIFEQANARIRRIGQTRKQQIIKLVSSQAERLAYQRLAQRQDLQHDVLSIIEELTGEGE